MILWCEACAKTHQFTAGDVERIVYSLVASEHDARLTHAQDRDGMGQCEPSGTFKRYGYVDAEFECLKTSLQMAGDVECYFEFVEGGRNGARAVAA